MARVAAGDGIEVISATPHIRHDHDVHIPELAGRVAELNAELERNGIPVEVVVGGEVAETALDGLDDEELRAVSLGGRRLDPAWSRVRGRWATRWSKQ